MYEIVQAPGQILTNTVRSGPILLLTGVINKVYAEACCNNDLYFLS